MFGLFKKRSLPSATDYGSALSDQACIAIKEKWIYFNKTMPFKADVTLTQRIEMFANPVSHFFRESYPQLSLGGPEMFWLVTFTAIAESGTHLASEVSAAMTQIQRQYSAAKKA